MSSPARHLGRHRLIALLAQGGMGDVWLAVSGGPGGFNKLVVIKELRSSFLEDPSFLAMFLEEGRISARLSHPHVVQTYEVGEEMGAHYIAMEYLDGQSLQRLRRRALDRGAPMPLALQIPVLLATLRALEYAHGVENFDGTPMRIVHRDVSPPNVMVTYDGQVKLLDFGIAKALDTSDETRAGTIKGKISYMSPEQALSDDIDQRTDIFGVGVMLAEAITGQRFWPRLPQARVFARLVSGELPSIRENARGVPEELLATCEKAISFDREGRYPSALAMRTDLEAVIEKYPELRADANATAAYLAQAFAAERAAVRGTIDTQLRAGREGSQGSIELVSLDSLHRDKVSSRVLPIADSSSQPSLPSSQPSSLAPLSSTMWPPAPAKTTPSLWGDPAAQDASVVASFRPDRRRIGVAAIIVGAALVATLYAATRTIESSPPTSPMTRTASAWPTELPVDKPSPATSPAPPTAASVGPPIAALAVAASPATAAAGGAGAATRDAGRAAEPARVAPDKPAAVRPTAPPRPVSPPPPPAPDLDIRRSR